MVGGKVVNKPPQLYPNAAIISMASSAVATKIVNNIMSSICTEAMIFIVIEQLCPSTDVIRTEVYS